MCHPLDSPSWKVINHRWLDFAIDSSNLRLSISTDGINPHSSLSNQHSYWAIVMITYNLLSWLSMKRNFMMLFLLILGPRQPGNDIDIYLAPLIKDLKLYGRQGWKLMMHIKKRSLHEGLFSYGQSMIFLHMKTCLVAQSRDIFLVQFVGGDLFTQVEAQEKELIYRPHTFSSMQSSFQETKKGIQW